MTAFLRIGFLLFFVQMQSQATPLADAVATELSEDELQQADSLALEVLDGETPEILQTSIAGKNDEAPALEDENKMKSLRDMEIAARYDSLWLRELRGYASLSDHLYEEILQISTENLDTAAIAVRKVNTEELKSRLALLDEKTPFNISYNPSLESVINSFLVRRKDLMERMIIASQFYFPMFEQALDKYDLPLEIKYLAIVESALNPRARSRVGATGLWQFMYGTGKMYGLDVSSYVDERRDPILATEAACQYLAKLF